MGCRRARSALNHHLLLYLCAVYILFCAIWAQSTDKLRGVKRPKSENYSKVNHYTENSDPTIDKRTGQDSLSVGPIKIFDGAKAAERRKPSSFIAMAPSARLLGVNAINRALAIYSSKELYSYEDGSPKWRLPLF